jgi:acylphosphatase
MSKVRAELKIHGRVQGVFYRQSTKETAVRLGLTGWVRNCPDGSVEAVFEGEKATVDQAVEWCRQGPPSARVTDVVVNWKAFDGELDGFEARR